jgi:hypothetical protein
MKALISPNEVFTYTWVTSWKKESNKWVPDTTNSIQNCQRVAQIEPDNKIFDVAQPLHWVDCSEDCVADQWYYKDGQVQAKPQDAPVPEGE